MRGMNSETVDLIATDPPFNKGVKAFEGIVDAATGKDGKKVSYKDTWTWGDVQAEWTEGIREDHPNLHAVIQTANAAAGEDMGAFLCWLGVRVLEMHRILKPTGSLYLHCDHTAGAYIKAMLDAVFGRENFRNEIVWCYKGMSPGRNRFSQQHDTVLFYAKSSVARFNVQRGQPDEGSLKTYEAAARIGYNANHSRKLVTIWDWEKYRNAVAEGKIPSGMKEVEFSGGAPPLRDWWADIKMLGGPRNKEKTGYPTQKPLALYERIIAASSNEGDLVLDPFAGCATTCVAAERLGRQWVAVDINKEAESVIHNRLQDKAQLLSEVPSHDRAVQVETAPPVRTDGGAVAAPELVLVSPKAKGPRISVRVLRERLAAEDGPRCQGCGWEPPNKLLEYMEVDHRIPKSLGGKDAIGNRVLLCAPCNGVKGNKLTLAELRLKRIEDGRMLNETWTMDWYAKVGKFG